MKWLIPRSIFDLLLPGCSRTFTHRWKCPVCGVQAYRYGEDEEAEAAVFTCSSEHPPTEMEKIK